MRGGLLVLGVAVLFSGAASASEKATIPTPRPDVNLAPAQRDKTVAKPRVIKQSGPTFDLARSKLCEKKLAAMRVSYKQLKPIKGKWTCGAERPLNITQIPSGKRGIPAIEITGNIVTRCEVALSLAKWVREVVVPSAQLHLNEAPQKIEISTSYQCRRRNNKATGKLSEHAFANGLDIMAVGFKKAGRVLAKDRRKTKSPERAFQAAIRGGACAYFTTVLGPVTNLAHADHFHLDMAERRGGYRLCQ